MQDSRLSFDKPSSFLLVRRGREIRNEKLRRNVYLRKTNKINRRES